MQLNSMFGPYFIAVIFLQVFGLYRCKTDSKQEIASIAGAYTLTHEERDGIESVSGPIEVNKIKIFTQDYYMQAQKNKLDSITSFEIGTYNLEGSNLIQQVIFSSYGPTNYKPTIDSFDLKIIGVDAIRLAKNKNSESKEHRQNVETYKRVGHKSLSIIDGVWQQTNIYSILGQDTTWDKGTNYKIMYDGYVIWGDFHIDPVTKKHNTFMGFGTFVLKGNNQLAETYIKSNYETNEGKTFHIDVAFKNDDEFIQSILDEKTGTRYIESYQRLKIM